MLSSALLSNPVSSVSLMNHIKELYSIMSFTEQLTIFCYLGPKNPLIFQEKLQKLLYVRYRIDFDDTVKGKLTKTLEDMRSKLFDVSHSRFGYFC